MVTEPDAARGPLARLRVFIRTYGCQMNERDSQAVLALLLARGAVRAKDEFNCDILLFNTCSVRDAAERKVMGKLGFTIRNKRENPKMIIGVMGCMAQNRGEEILQKWAHVDFAVGTEQLHKIPDLIEELLQTRQRRLLDSMDDPAILNAMSGHVYEEDEAVSPFSGSIAIMRGCSRHCAYCIVPTVRGPEQSRTVQSILDEAQGMVDNGITEILLLGQNVAAFGLDNQPPPPRNAASPFAALLHELCRIPNLKRLSFTSPHPAYFSDQLIDTIASEPKMSHLIHLPLQSGSDTILKAMNRPYTSARYMEIVDALRERIPGVMFSTDIIVGFPGETAEDFEETRRIVRLASFDNAFIFKYSPRKGTRAARMDNQLPEEVKAERNAILLNDLKELGLQHNQALNGQTFEVLVEGPSKRNAARFSGRTNTGKVVIFDPNDTLRSGDFVRIRINSVTPATLYGDLV